jgi:hypothetical protein
VQLCITCHLVTHPRFKGEFSPLRQLRMQLTFQAQQDVPFFAPVARQVARGVLNQAHPDVIELLRASIGHACLTRVFRHFDLRPVRRTKWDVFHLHDISPGWFLMEIPKIYAFI